MQHPHYSSHPSTPIFRTIEGSLPGGKRLAEPLAVRIDYDEGEYLVSEMRYYLHAGAPTIEEAIAEFKRILSDELDALISDEAELAPRLQAQLRYLRSIIRTM